MAKQDVVVELHYDAAWQDHTADTLTRDEISMSRGAQDWGSQPAPDNAQLTFRGWSLVTRNPTDPLHGKVRLGTPLRITIDGEIRFEGAITSLSPRQSVGGDRWVEVEAAGDTRREGMGTDPARPALERATVREPLVRGAWSLAGLGQGVTRIPALVGEPGVVRPIDAVGVDFTRQRLDFAWQWSADTLAPGLGALPSVTSANAGFGFTGTVGARIDTITRGWSFWTRAELDPGQDVHATVWLDTTNTSWVLWVLHGDDPLVTIVRVLGFDSEGINTVWLEPADPLPYTDQWRNFAVIVRGSPGSVTLLVDGAEVPLTVFSGSIPSGFPGPSLRVRATALLTEGHSVSIGYPTYVIGTLVGEETVATFQRLYAAGRGHLGEPAGRRIERLATEAGVALDVVGDLDATEAMGPQHPDELLAVAREAADTDHGFLNDARDGAGWRYRTHGSLYDQTPALVLDYTAQQMAPPLDPVIDFQGVRNDITASRRDGGSHQAVREEGPLSVQAPPDGVGRWPAPLPVNTTDDLRLPDHAGWRLHVGTVDAPRFPRVTVDLVATPALAEDAASVDIGDVIEILNLPVDLSPAPLRLLVLGYSERVGSHTRTLTFNTVPADGWTVATYADDEDEPAPDAPARYSPTSATLYGAGHSGANPPGDFVVGTDTELVLAGEVWTTDPDAYPFDLNIAGSRIRATGHAGSALAPSRVFLTVDAAPVNGFTQTIPTGAPVSLWAPARYAL